MSGVIQLAMWYGTEGICGGILVELRKKGGIKDWIWSRIANWILASSPGSINP